MVIVADIIVADKQAALFPDTNRGARTLFCPCKRLPKAFTLRRLDVVAT